MTDKWLDEPIVAKKEKRVLPKRKPPLRVAVSVSDIGWGVFWGLWGWTITSAIGAVLVTIFFGGCIASALQR